MKCNSTISQGIMSKIYLAVLLQLMLVIQMRCEPPDCTDPLTYETYMHGNKDNTSFKSISDTVNYNWVGRASKIQKRETDRET